jgi:membrane protease subunit HflK
MPWSNQSGGGGGGGGPWGGGPGAGGPWGRPPQGGGGPGGTPPDLEELIRRSQDRLRSVLPGGGGPLGARGIAALAAVALGALVLWNSTFTIEPDQVGIVTRFGAYQAPPRQPGLNFMFWPIDQAQMVRVTRVNQEEIGFRSRGDRRQEIPDEALMLTRDENIVSVGFTVSWSIRPDRPQDFVFNVADQQQAVRAVAESAMREIVGRNTAEDVITRGQIILQTEVTRIIQDTLDSYQSGIQINALSVSRPEVPPAVREAFNDVQQAGQDAQTFQNQARRDANQLLADARATANQLRQEADAYAQRVVAEAQGESARFVSIYNEYRNAPDVTQRRLFLETMERVFRGTNKVVIEPGQAGDAGRGVLPVLPLGGLVPPPPAPATPQPSAPQR